MCAHLTREAQISPSALAACAWRTKDVCIIDVIEAPFAQVRQAQSGIAIRFRLDKETRRQLIARLFTGGYANEVRQIKLGRLIRRRSEAIGGLTFWRTPAEGRLEPHGRNVVEPIPDRCLLASENEKLLVGLQMRRELRFDLLGV